MRFKLNPFAPNGVSIVEEQTTIVKQSAGFASPGKDGRVQSVVAGSNVTVNSADPANPIVSATSAANPFITSGINGVTTIRFQSTPGAVLYDLTIDDTGHVVTTAVVTTVSRFIPVWFNLIPQ